MLNFRAIHEQSTINYATDFDLTSNNRNLILVISSGVFYAQRGFLLEAEISGGLAIGSIKC